MSDNPLRGLTPYNSVPEKFRRRGYRHTLSWVFFGIFIATVRRHGPFVIRSLGGTALHSLLLNVAMGLPLVMAWLWMPLVERRNPVRLTGLLLGIGGLLLMGSAFVQSTLALALVLAATMLCATLYRPIFGTALQQIYPREWRGKLLSLPSTLDMLTRALWLVLAGRLLTLDLQSYHRIFPLAGLCMLVGGWLFRGISGGRGIENDDGGGDLTVPQYVRTAFRRAVENRVLLVFLLGYMAVASGGVIYGNTLPLFARDELALTPGQWGYAQAARLGAMLLSFWFWGRFMDRFGAPFTMVLCWGAMAVLSGAMFYVESWPVFLALLVARGLIFAGNILAFFPQVMHFTRASETARGMGLHTSLWGLRWMLMPLVVIAVVDLDLFPKRFLFLGSFALMVIGTVVMTAVWWKDRRSGPAQGA